MTEYAGAGNLSDARPADWRPVEVWRAVPGRNTHKVSHLLAADLRRQILNGELVADQQLPSEAALIASLHVSRDTLREALRILESQSLIEIRRGRGGGAVVRRPGLDAVARYVALLLQLRKATLGHLEEARSVVEPPAAEQLAVRAGSDEMERLIELHDAERAAENDPLAFVTAAAAFDQAVTELSGNRTCGVVAGVFRDIYAAHAYVAIASTDGTVAERVASRVVVSHSAYLDAARRRDGLLAKKTWSDYLYTTSRMFVSRTRSRQPIHMTPLWRARAAQAPAGASQRRATSVATEIRARIAEGELQEGDRLPPLAELATEFGISRPTLREALRILEMEFLLDLRTGDRGGGTIRTPSTHIAAQLAGIVLEARQATLVDFYRALRLIEPPIIELVATRIGAKAIERLAELSVELASTVDDTSAFVATWETASVLTFAATRNPALTITAEIVHWVLTAVNPAVTADADGLPFVGKSNRRAQAMFSELVAALAARDPARARDAWVACQDYTAPFIEGSDLGARLVIDLVG